MMHQRQDSDPSLLTGLPEAERTRAWERFQAIRPFLEEGVSAPSKAPEQKAFLRWGTATRRKHGVSLRDTNDVGHLLMRAGFCYALPSAVAAGAVTYVAA
jgi:hypothetical protein